MTRMGTAPRRIALGVLGAMWALGGAVTANGSPAAPARPAPAAQLDDGLTWTPASVRAHDPTIAVPAGDAPLLLGVRRPVSPTAAAAMWLDDGDVVRLSTTAPAALATLRARAITTTPAGHLAVEATLVERADDRLLLVPPGAGGWWLVDATTPAEVTLETLTRRLGRLVWERYLDEVSAWIAGAGAGRTSTAPPTSAAQPVDRTAPPADRRRRARRRRRRAARGRRDPGHVDPDCHRDPERQRAAGDPRRAARPAGLRRQRAARRRAARRRAGDAAGAHGRGARGAGDRRHRRGRRRPRAFGAQPRRGDRQHLPRGHERGAA
jgi:hypothetical protein